MPSETGNAPYSTDISAAVLHARWPQASASSDTTQDVGGHATLSGGRNAIIREMDARCQRPDFRHPAGGTPTIRARCRDHGPRCRAETRAVASSTATPSSTHEGSTVSAAFEQLAAEQTSMGLISLRRRREPSRQVDVYEVKLGDDYLMSSLFTAAERELATLGLARCRGDDLQVVVGGLGLGYTAVSTLADPRVASLVVIEALPPVVAWHRDGLLPDARVLRDDARVEVVTGDFFGTVAAGQALDGRTPDRRYDAILVDIDHSPTWHLDPSHASFYTPAGLQRLSRHLVPGGVFALWSDAPPDEDFLATLATAFDEVDARIVRFPNHYLGRESANTVYVCA